MIDLFSFVKAVPFKCPENYFINPTYECVKCKEGQILELDGTCKCKEPDQFINPADGKCRSCPSDSEFKNGKCDCSKNEKNKIFNETSWQCSRPTKTLSDDYDCLDDQYRNPYTEFYENDEYYHPCVECPNGKVDGSTSQDDPCKCNEGEQFIPNLGICINTTCNENFIYSFIYRKCITCGEIESGIQEPPKQWDQVACICPEGKFFSILTTSCEPLPDYFEKNDYSLRCKDQNSIVDRNNSICISCPDDGFAFNGKCYCKDLTKYYNSTEKKCVSCGDYKVRDDYYSNECSYCTDNHFVHIYEEDGQLKWKCKECPYKSDGYGCFCKRHFENFDYKTEKCFSCGKGAHIETNIDGSSISDLFYCECDDEDEYYDDDLRKCIKCPKEAIVTEIPFLYNSYGSYRESCLCPLNKIYDRKSNKCLEACSEGETFGYECLPCPKYGSSDGSKQYCNCEYGYWDIETQTCKLYGEWSSSSYMKLCFGLFLIILFL